MGQWTLYCPACGTNLGDVYDDNTAQRTQSAHDEVCEKKQTKNDK